MQRDWLSTHLEYQNLIFILGLSLSLSQCVHTRVATNMLQKCPFLSSPFILHLLWAIRLYLIFTTGKHRHIDNIPISPWINTIVKLKKFTSPIYPENSSSLEKQCIISGLKVFICQLTLVLWFLSHSSDIYITRNISCPVSPVGSPLLHPRSPHHLSGRMSPSPISSPRTTSGSSTPLTGGIGAIPFHNQPILSQESFVNLQMRPPSPSANSPSYWDPDILRGPQSGSLAFRELTTSYDNDALGKQFGRGVAAAANGDPYDGQSILADRVSQQLLMDPVKLNQSLDLSPSSSLACRRMTGVWSEVSLLFHTIEASPFVFYLLAMLNWISRIKMQKKSSTVTEGIKWGMHF